MGKKLQNITVYTNSTSEWFKEVFVVEKTGKLNNPEFRICSIIKAAGIYYAGIFDNEHNFYATSFSKLIKNLNMKIDEEHDEKYIEIILKNNSDKRHVCGKNVVNCPDCRKFEIGEKVQIGSLDSTEIISHTDDYNFYYVKCVNYDNDKKSQCFQVFNWSSVFPYKCAKVPFEVKQSNIRYYNSTLDSIYDKIFHFGLDIHPINFFDFQRPFVWSEQMQYEFIDAIFNKRFTGAIIFCENKDIYEAGKSNSIYCVIDGQQRVTTIINFITGKFKYNGLYYHEMNRRNRDDFDNTMMLFGDLEFASKKFNEKEILENFVSLNSHGITVEKDAIDRAIERIKEIDNI